MARSMLGVGRMATARRFEDLEAWQLASELTDTVFRLTENGKAAADFEFCDQIREAAQNAPPLIAEGFVRYTPTNS
jgi:four helix bundle protein